MVGQFCKLGLNKKKQYDHFQSSHGREESVVWRELIHLLHGQRIDDVNRTSFLTPMISCVFGNYHGEHYSRFLAYYVESHGGCFRARYGGHHGDCYR